MYNKSWKLVLAATNFALPIVALTIIGYIFDKRLLSQPWGTAVGIILGAIISFYNLWSSLKKAMKNENL